MRSFACIELTLQQALLLRETIRPLDVHVTYHGSMLISFCERLYALILLMETRHFPESNLLLTHADVMLVNHFLGAEDFKGAADVLAQSRAALGEILSGKPTVYLARTEDMEKLMQEKPASDGALVNED
jgi:hypothetical protein